MNKIFWIFLFISIITVNKIYATNWYIDKNASGTNNGTSWDNAWQSFSDINWENILPGDTIFISGGSNSVIYYETLNINKSGSSDNPITICIGQEQEHNGEIVIDAQAIRNNCIDGNIQQNIIIDGEYNEQRRITVRNSLASGIDFTTATGVVIRYVNVVNCGRPGAPAGYGHGIKLSRARDGSEIAYCLIDTVYQDAIFLNQQFDVATDWGHGCKIHHNTIRHFSDDGITMSEGNDVYNNTIGPWYPGGIGHPDGIQYYGCWNRIYNNLFFDDANWGSNAFIFADLDGGHDTDHHLIYNNVFIAEDSSYYEHRWRGVGVKLENGVTSIDDVVIANNTFIDLGYEAIGVAFNSSTNIASNIRIYNNLIYNCRTGSDYGCSLRIFDANFSNLEVNSNLIFEGESGTQNIEYRSVRYTSVSDFDNASGFTNFYGAANFLSYEPGAGIENNLNLNVLDSLAIDKGMNLSSYFTTDKNGVLRPQGANWDIGAYEYFDGVLNISNEPSIQFFLEQNSPNPFSSYTVIKYYLPDNTLVNLSIYDLLGRQIQVLVNKEQSTNWYSIEWDGTDNSGYKLPNGIYILKLETKQKSFSRKMIISR